MCLREGSLFKPANDSDLYVFCTELEKAQGLELQQPIKIEEVKYEKRIQDRDVFWLGIDCYRKAFTWAHEKVYRLNREPWSKHSIW